MKLTKSLLAAIALGVSVGSVTTSCNASENATISQTPEVVSLPVVQPLTPTETEKVDENGNPLPSVTPEQVLPTVPFKDPCPACGRG